MKRRSVGASRPMWFYVWLASLVEQRRYRILAIVLVVALPLAVAGFTRLFEISDRLALD